MQKRLSALFVALCLLLCAVPSVGMAVRPTTEPIGNERSTALPAVKTPEGKLNLRFFPELGDWFEKHFAFRPELMTADAAIGAGVFGVSNVDSVIVGTDGWLYYASTLNDYCGRGQLTDAQIDGVVHNLGLIRDYARQNGADFLFTVAPNKNTLYPEHMPYYDRAAVSNVRNRDRLNAALADSDIAYVNLFDLFAQQNETLYLKQDSHWNNKGALLAYNAITAALGKAHPDYADVQATRKKDFAGDLAAMLYPAAHAKEYNYDYGAQNAYTTAAASVEEPFITTENLDAGGSLYMYRDSFGNSLLPFFASAYGTATFTKSFPMVLSNDLPAAKPDVFVMELVERNIDWLLKTPPVLPAPRREITLPQQCGESVDVTAEICPYSSEYIEISGNLLYDKEEGSVCVALTGADGKTAVYECYAALDADGNDGYLAYVPAADYPAGAPLTVTVLSVNGTVCAVRGSQTVVIGGSYETH